MENNTNKNISTENKTNADESKKKKIRFISKDSIKDLAIWLTVSLGLFLILEYLSRKSSFEKVQLFIKDNTYATVINILLILGITGIIFFFKHKKAVLWIISFLILGLGKMCIRDRVCTAKKSNILIEESF